MGHVFSFIQTSFLIFWKRFYSVFNMHFRYFKIMLRILLFSITGSSFYYIFILPLYLLNGCLYRFLHVDFNTFFYKILVL